MRMEGNGYITTSSKRFGYTIIKVQHPGYEPAKFWIYTISSEDEPETFVKERPDWASAVSWCKLNRRDGKKNSWDR